MSGPQRPLCLTCSDQATPARILAMLPDDFARVETGCSVEEVHIGLVDAAVGDRVLVHAGVAIGRLP